MIATMATRLVSPITIGRRTELDAALGVLDAAVAGSVTHLLITGEAGVGKTRLVGELAVAATARGVRVLRGSCASVGDQGLPYGPIVEILAEVARGTEPDELLALVGTSGPDLARLVPALDPSSSAAHVQREFLQARLLDALAGLLRRLSESAPVLVIVEDVHWADPATRETLGFLVRSLRTEPVVVAMTLRSDELHRRHPAMPWISELERTGRVSRIDLARLDADETAAMLASITGEAPSAMVASRFHRRSDGNPFFIEELVLAETGQGSARLRRRCRRSSPRGSGRCPSPPDPSWASWPPPVAASITTSSPRPPIGWTSTTSTPPSAMRSRARSWSSTPTPRRPRAMPSATPCSPRWRTTTCSPASAGASTGPAPRRWRRDRRPPARRRPRTGPSSRTTGPMRTSRSTRSRPRWRRRPRPRRPTRSRPASTSTSARSICGRPCRIPRGSPAPTRRRSCCARPRWRTSPPSVDGASRSGARRSRWSARARVRSGSRSCTRRSVAPCGPTATPPSPWSSTSWRSRRCPPSRRPPSERACCRATGRC